MTTKREIIWHIVNSVIAGLLVFLGSLTSGTITYETIAMATLATGIVILTKFNEFWKEEKNDFIDTTPIFSFI